MRLLAALCLLVPCLTALPGCSSTGQADGTRPENAAPAPGSHALVAPDKCRLRCTVLRVEKLRDRSGPCSQAPCTAMVRIDSLLGYGFAFPPVLAEGQTIRARFVFTIERSDRWFPTLSVVYPGVKPEGCFIADVQLAGSADMPSADSGIVVEGYSLCAQKERGE